jgi:hypothetical protein
LQLNGEPASLDRIDFTLAIDDNTANGVLISNVSDSDLLISHLTLSADDVEARWDIRWERKQQAGTNLSVELSLRVFQNWAIGFTCAGNLLADETIGLIDAQIRSANLVLDIPAGSLEAALNGRYMLRASNEAISMNGARLPLAEIGELDVLSMIGRLMAHPQLGDLLSGLLPF